LEAGGLASVPKLLAAKGNSSGFQFLCDLIN